MKHVHYGWVVCITCTLLLFITMGTVSNGFSVYLPYIMDERGLTHAQTSSLVTLRCLTAFLAMLVIGWYYKKVSLRLGVSIAACAEYTDQLYEYTPMQVKQAIVGWGGAEKKQIQQMVKMLLHMETIAKPDDAADAIAIALTHAAAGMARGQFRMK